MEKRILIVSITAVVILVLVSFTGVVGYQTTKSSTIARASPLFSIRSKRAIGQGQKDITTNYLGHGEETNILFSSRMKRTELAQRAVNIISKMGDKAFSKFIARIILNMKNQGQITDKDTSDVLQVLQHIRRNPNDMMYYDTENINRVDTTEFVSCGAWQPGCIIVRIYGYLVLILFFIGTSITNLFSCFGLTSGCFCP